MKTLEAHKDSHKEVRVQLRDVGVILWGSGDGVTNWLLQVVRAAEEAASTLAASIHPEQCLKVLCPIVQTADYPINLAAIKMQTRAIERIAKEPLNQLLSDIIPGLLQVRSLSQRTSCTVPALLHSSPFVSFRATITQRAA